MISFVAMLALTVEFLHNFYRAMLCISAVYAVMRCLFVRLSRSYHVETNKHIFDFFFTVG